jgi:hypothetical protein
MIFSIYFCNIVVLNLFSFLFFNVFILRFCLFLFYYLIYSLILFILSSNSLFYSSLLDRRLLVHHRRLSRPATRGVYPWSAALPRGRGALCRGGYCSCPSQRPSCLPPGPPVCESRRRNTISRSFNLQI